MTMLMIKKTVRVMRAAVTAAVVMTAKTMGKKRALTVKLAPRRLISSGESTLVTTFASHVLVEAMNLYIRGLRPLL
jgi:3-methyladenine DNA glycosylase AlkC